jgi:hypothetical protein
VEMYDPVKVVGVPDPVRASARSLSARRGRVTYEAQRKHDWVMYLGAMRDGEASHRPVRVTEDGDHVITSVSLHVGPCASRRGALLVLLVLLGLRLPLLLANGHDRSVVDQRDAADSRGKNQPIRLLDDRRHNADQSGAKHGRRGPCSDGVLKQMRRKVHPGGWLVHDHSAVQRAVISPHCCVLPVLISSPPFCVKRLLWSGS